MSTQRTQPTPFSLGILFLSVAALVILARPPACAVQQWHGIPAVSPDGKQIAFITDAAGKESSELCVIAAAGGSSRRIHTPPAPKKWGVQWVRGGERIRYTSGVEDTVFLWEVDLARGTPTLLARRVAMALQASNDGRWIAYTLGSYDCNRIFVSPIDADRPVAVSDSMSAHWSLAWSPDDRWIAFTRSDTTDVRQIRMVRRDGSEERRLTNSAIEKERPQGPAWCSSGRMIAFQAGRYDRTDPTRSISHLWVVDVNSGQATQLAPHGAGRIDECPTWFPDGRHVAFQSNRTGSTEVWVMAADGSGERQLTH